MSKHQKIVLLVSLMLYFVPEILWSPILNILYQLSQTGNVLPLRENFLNHVDNIFLYKFILIVQTISIITSVAVLAKASQKKLSLWFAVIVLSILTLVTVSVSYISFALSNISF